MVDASLARSDYYVYVLFCETGEPFYVGKGRKNRWLEHEYKVQPSRGHKDRIIHNLLATLGEVPKIKIAEGLTNQDACAVEMAMISVLGRYPNGPLTNQTAGGEGLIELSENARERQRQATLLAVKSDKHRAAISAKFKGTKQSTVHLAARSAALKEVSADPEWRAAVSARLKGKKKSEEHCRAMSAALKGRRQSPELVEKRISKIRGRKVQRAPEHQAALQASVAEAMRRPEVRAKMSAMRKGKKKSPELIAKQWTPERRAAHSETVKIALARRKVVA